MGRIKRTLFITGGVICVILGVIGIFVPVMPTTSFLLLAAFLFARSSDRALYWLEHNRWFGAYIRNYRAGRGIPVREKVVTLSFLWVTIGLTVVFAVHILWVRLLLIGIAIAVTVHVLKVKTYRPQAALDSRPPESEG